VEKKNNFKKGFTLIELLLVIALVLILGISTSAFFGRFYYQMSVRDASEAIVGAIREAQSLAMSGKNNSSWGVKHEPSKITVFKGDSFSGRDQSADQIFPKSSGIEISGFDEIIFSPPSGFPTQTFSHVTVSRRNIEESFSINSEGAIE
jgi:prepilin-type N-terminal cleavage/methylation domain-containing protein